MTASDLACLRAQIALLRSTSPTKGPAPRYSDEDLARAVRRATGPLAFRPFRRP